jgi:hypothetical protein
VDFTREPILETIITPKEGYKLVIRSSKSAGQEEYFVDAVEIVAFGHALFFRSLERPKAFLVPVSDYEVLEVREARMVLKNVGLDRSIKIGGGREGALKSSREEEKAESVVVEEKMEQEEIQPIAEAKAEGQPEMRLEKKRDRRRHYRKRRGRDEGTKEVAEPSVPPLEDEKIQIPPPEEEAETAPEAAPMASTLLSSLLQPPPTLISETISRYRQNELFKGAFYLTEEEQYKPHDKVQELLNEEDEEESFPPLQEPTFLSEAESVEGSLEEPSSTEYEEEREWIEEPSSEETEASDEKADEESSFVFKEEEQEETSEFSLPLYAEEDLSMEPHSEQEEEKPIKNNRHSFPDQEI